MLRSRYKWALALTCLVPVAAAAQTPAKKIDVSGEVSLTSLLLPNQPDGDSTREIRSRARLEVTADPSTWLRLKFDGTVDGLLADRQGRVDVGAPAGHRDGDGG